MKNALLVAVLAGFAVTALAQTQPESSTPTPNVYVQPRITQAVDEAQLTVLRGNTHPLARPQFDQGAAPPDMPLQRMLLVLKRSPEQQAALTTLLDAQQDKSSPSYHKWLTPEQFGAQFGPADEDVQVVSSWLQSHGFQVSPVTKGRTTIEFSGTAAQVQQALHTQIHKYLVNGEEHWANATDPQIPSALTPVVAGVNSLHNFFSKPMNIYVGTYSLKTRELTSPNPDFSFVCGGFQCYGVVPYDFAIIYDVLPLWTAAPTPIDGTGQSIAIVGRTNVNQNDATTFWNLLLYNLTLPSPKLNVVLNGSDPGINGDEAEADIDIQWSGAVAPGATVDFVTSASTETTDGVDLSAVYIVDNNVAPVMSESYGLCELGFGTAGNQFHDLLWEQAAAQGISVFVSTGDNMAAGCDNPSGPAQYGLNVNGLASTPYNVAVGGTDFNEYNKWSTYWSLNNDPNTQASALGPIPETSWNDSCTNGLLANLTGGTTNPETNCNNTNFAGFLDSTGGSGGKSNCIVNNQTLGSCQAGYAKPSWQSGAGVPSDNLRDLPDVSLFASNGFLGSMYMICQQDLTGACNVNQLVGYGGTSVASPAFAGIMALVNQKMNGPQGNPNFVLYKLAASKPTSFHDVVAGSTIAAPCLKGSPNCTVKNSAHSYGVLSGYSTSANYDLATGLGSVDVANMVNNWNTVAFTSTSMTNLALNPITITHGQRVNVTGNVTPAAATGDVALLVDIGPGTTTGQAIDAFTLSAGALSGTTNLLPGGSYKVIAHYAGNGTYGGTYSNTVSVNVGKENSHVFVPGVETGVDNAGNPVYATSVGYGSLYQLRVDVQNSQSAFCNPPPLGEIACPSGNVVLTDNGNPLDAGTYLLNSYGYTEDPTIQLSGGSHTLQANYAGDNSYNASTASVPITVIPASTTMGTIYIWNPVVGYQLSPSVYVNTTSSGLAPTGTVTFYANGTPMTGPVTYTPYNGGPNRGNASLNASLNTTTSPFPTPGTYAITASYSGDANYTSSTAAPQNISVKFPMPAVALQSSSYSVPGGTTLTFTATVYSSSSTIAPTGTLTFTSDTYGQLPGTPTYSTITDPSGNLDLQATLTYTINASDNFMVTYSGDANYPGNTTGSGLITVTGTDFNLTFPQSTMTVLPGQSNSLNLIVGLQSDSPPVTFGATACSGLPAESACSFSPSSAGRTSVVQVTVTSTAPHQVARLGRPSGLPFWASSGVTLAGVFLLGVSGKRRPWSKFLGLIFLAVLAFGIGCGGGGGGGGGHNDPGTPAGTYPITVTGTSGSGANAISHTTSFTLVVQ